MRSRLILAVAAASACLGLVNSARADWLVKTYMEPYIWNYGTADALIGGWGNAGAPTTISPNQWNTADLASDPGGRGVFNTGDFQSPASGDNFAIRGTGNIIVAFAGDYRFYNNTDDGSRLKIDGVTVISDDNLSGDHDASANVTFLSPGTHSVDWMWFEYGGGAQGEVSYENLTTPGTGRQLLGMAGTPGAANGVTLDASAIVKGYKGNVTDNVIDTLSKALTLAGDASKQFGPSELHAVVNIEQADSVGHYPGGYAPPGTNYTRPAWYSVLDDDDYAVTATGYLRVLTEGDYKFAELTDDGGALRLDGTAIIVDDSLHGAGDPGDVKYSAMIHLTAGYHLIESLYFERGGGSSGEVFLVDANNNPIALVGDVAGGGLEVSQSVPEPGILSVLALGSIFALRRRRNGQL